MTPILTEDYFIGEILIPNITGTDNASVARLADLEYYMTVFEEEYLRRVMGDDLFEEFEAGMLEDEPAEEWTTLAAVIYFTDNSLPFSAAAHYVYCRYMQHIATITATGGEIKPVFENASVASLNQKIVRAWNRMVDLTETITEFIEDNPETYTTYTAPDVDDFEKMNQWGI